MALVIVAIGRPKQFGFATGTNDNSCDILNAFVNETGQVDSVFLRTVSMFVVDVAFNPAFVMQVVKLLIAPVNKGVFDIMFRLFRSNVNIACKFKDDGVV